MVLVIKTILEALTHATAYKAGGTLPALSDVYCSRLKKFAESISKPRIGQFCGTFLQVYSNIVLFSAKGMEEPASQRYVAESEDDIFTTFDYYMDGGPARLQN